MDKAWHSISAEVIVNSFVVCRITIAVDGLEDDRIRVFKADGAVPTGREHLTHKRMEAAVGNLLLNFDDVEIDAKQDGKTAFSAMMTRFWKALLPAGARAVN